MLGSKFLCFEEWTSRITSCCPCSDKENETKLEQHISGAQLPVHDQIKISDEFINAEVLLRKPPEMMCKRLPNDDVVKPEAKDKDDLESLAMEISRLGDAYVPRSKEKELQSAAVEFSRLGDAYVAAAKHIDSIYAHRMSHGDSSGRSPSPKLQTPLRKLEGKSLITESPRVERWNPRFETSPSFDTKCNEEHTLGPSAQLLQHTLRAALQAPSATDTGVDENSYEQLSRLESPQCTSRSLREDSGFVSARTNMSMSSSGFQCTPRGDFVSDGENRDLQVSLHDIRSLEELVARTARSRLGCLNFENTFRVRQREGHIVTLRSHTLNGETFGQACNIFARVTLLGLKHFGGKVTWAPQDDVKIKESDGVLLIGCTPFAMAMGMVTATSLQESDLLPLPPPRPMENSIQKENARRGCCG
jgi:hypothetical protein